MQILVQNAYKAAARATIDAFLTSGSEIEGIDWATVRRLRKGESETSRRSNVSGKRPYNPLHLPA
jgi:hypothetical protein